MSCELSPSAAAFSTVLSAFVGSVINGLTSGMFIAFITGWIAWFSVFRILAAGVFEMYLTVKAGTNFPAVNDTRYQNINLDGLNGDGSPSTETGNQPLRPEDIEFQPNAPMDPSQIHPPYNQPPPFLAPSNKPTRPGVNPRLPMGGRIEHTVTVFGWLGWIWSAVYTPLSQTIWLCIHISSSSGIHQVVRALAIGVSALGLTFDYKQRYGAALGQKWGAWAFVTFNAWNAGACMLLGVEAAVLLIHGAMANGYSNILIGVAVLYSVFCIIWAAVSWRLVPPIDGARSGNIFAGVLMGAFAGLFVAAPALMIWQNAKFAEKVAGTMGDSAPSGLNLGDYLACQGASGWAKFAAIMP